jgi:hypothetical protein
MQEVQCRTKAVRERHGVFGGFEAWLAEINRQQQVSQFNHDVHPSLAADPPATGFSLASPNPSVNISRCTEIENQSARVELSGCVMA